ncbi:hypothetical protein EV714DRAFT_286841 [Schizophyllum commune]
MRDLHVILRMHPCLAIPEIVSIVCDFLRAEQDEQWRRTWLLSLSAACRAFNAPTLSKHIRPTDLVKFNFYARLVQELHVSWLPDTTSPLLPNLRSLHWYCVGSPAFSFILMLVHPWVTRLEINMALSSSHPLSLCPDIRHFRSLEYTIHVAPRWERLQTLDHLAAAPQLLKLCVRSLPDDFHRSGISIAQPAFTSLRALELRPQAMHLATGFLQARLKISPNETKKACHWEPLLTSLRTLSICDSGRYDEDDDDLEYTALSLGAVEKLFVFRHLTALTLDSWGGFSIDDDEFPAFAQAFPDIEDLRLLAGLEDANRHDATIYAVASVAQFCPRLRVLHMDFDADAYIYEEHETRGITQRCLTHLNVSFLSALEGMEVVPSSIHRRRTKKMKWRQVARLLPMLRFVRAQERRDSYLRRLDGEAEMVEMDQANPPLDEGDYNTDYSDL